MISPLGIGGGSHLRVTEVAVISLEGISGGMGTGPGSS